jgi:hypothetical protein
MVFSFGFPLARVVEEDRTMKRVGILNSKEFQ